MFFFLSNKKKKKTNILLLLLWGGVLYFHRNYLILPVKIDEKKFFFFSDGRVYLQLVAKIFFLLLFSERFSFLPVKKNTILFLINFLFFFLSKNKKKKISFSFSDEVCYFQLYFSSSCPKTIRNKKYFLLLLFRGRFFIEVLQKKFFSEGCIYN